MWNESLVVVVDDDEGVRRAVQRALAAGGYRTRAFGGALEYLAEREGAGDGPEAACLVLDIKLPDLDGLAMLRELRGAGVETPAVFITGSGDLRAAVGAMKLGAVDLLEKPLDAEALLRAVGRATQTDAARLVERRHLAELWAAAARLTPREAEVAALVTSGRLNKQIAAAIGTTEKTVKVHRARAMAKLGARSVAELVRLVDHLLGADAPSAILTDGPGGHRTLARPPALAAMAAALHRHAPPRGDGQADGPADGRPYGSHDAPADVASHDGLADVGTPGADRPADRPADRTGDRAAAVAFTADVTTPRGSTPGRSRESSGSAAPPRSR
ncbi:MAG: response regulator transcription factor [Gemmatimonadaceae bacterium]